MREMLGVATAALLALGAACGGRKEEQPPRPAPLPARPFAGLAGQQVIVLPTHYLRPDTLGWSARVTDQRGMLAALDSAIERVLGDRGFRTSWIYPPTLARSAKRNAGYVADPYALAGEGLRPLARSPSMGQIRDPLASQLRSLVAMTSARYALFPVELRFEAAAGGDARPVLRVALIDARLSSVRWSGDVRGNTAAAPGPAVLESVATSLADLVSAP